LFYSLILLSNLLFFIGRFFSGSSKGVYGGGGYKSVSSAQTPITASAYGST